MCVRACEYESLFFECKCHAMQCAVRISGVLSCRYSARGRREITVHGVCFVGRYAGASGPT